MFFGAGAVLTATGERDMEHLGGLIHRMPQTAFAFLVGCAAISALPPLNGFVSEWLTFQAILLSPQLPSWGLKFLVPAVGALLALSAALAAACFVKAFGVTFLGRPRTPRRADRAGDRPLLAAAMFLLAALCLVAGILPGLFIDALAPVVQALVGERMPVQIGVAMAVDRADRRKAAAPTTGCWSSCSWSISGTLAAICHPPPRLRQAAPRAGLGLRLSRCEPGDAIHRDELRPADPPRVRHRRLSRPRAASRCRRPATRVRRGSWSRCAIRSGKRSTRRSAAGVSFAAERLNRLQFLTIRQFLSLVFAPSSSCCWCSRYGPDRRSSPSRARRCCWCCCWRRCSPASCAR